ncbi:Serine/arginine-rich SC35-like splicing factor SCL28 [Thalictrum thalictroides]|uniref:Serine/arginine-rich SC35-like splicing factor SCL28 n=1 Tax=Thalictrum thalictroides TaxID=46969 RepID=A0A7J6VLV1_THATH|nr:Serine/arginine-rich SC35-like splicing factor SCL28 [Thalictrum thalictroides]
MGRYRSRSRSYSPSRYSRSPPRRKRYDDPRDKYRGGRSSSRRSSGPSGLLVRNISLDARPEDLRVPFERFGPVKDVYLPKNYYTGEPRGFGFVKFHSAEDAAEAKEQMNHQIIGGREIRIVFAEENRKTPQEMRVTARVSDRYRRRSPPRSPRRRYHSYSRSPSADWDEQRDRGRYTPRRSISRSPSPRRGRSISRSLSPRRRRSISRSPLRRGRSISRSPPRRGRSISRSPPPRGRSISRTPPPRGRSMSRSPPRGRTISRSPSPRGKSISRSPPPRGRYISRSPPHERSRFISRSPPPRGRSASRSLSPRGKRSMLRTPSRDEDYRKDQRSPSPRENGLDR